MTALPANPTPHIQVMTPGQCRTCSWEGGVRASLQHLKTETVWLREGILMENMEQMRPSSCNECNSSRRWKPWKRNHLVLQVGDCVRVW